MRDELKVVITQKNNRTMVGIQAPDCDPVLTLVEGDLSAALQQIPALVDQANQQWDANPRYPETDIPEPAPAAPTPSTSTRAGKPASQQNSWF